MESFCSRCLENVDPFTEEDCFEITIDGTLTTVCRDCLEKIRTAAFDAKLQKPAQPVIVHNDGPTDAIASTHVTIKKFAEETGFSEDAIRSRIKRGQWMEGQMWIKRGNRVLMSLEGCQVWLKNTKA